MSEHHHTPSLEYPLAVWRVIIHRPADGPANMAIDEAITESVRDRLTPPTLRFYAWEPPCLSLGYAQPVSDIDLERLGVRGWGLVRRLTGGRAILHTDEVTYSVAVPEDDPRVAGGIVESYRRLSQGLAAGLEELEVQTHSEKASGDAHHFKGPICFEVPSDYEITAREKKLLGSAQSRRDGVVLQHGSLPLRGDLTRICDVLAFDDEADREAARQRVRERAITLADALGQGVGLARAVGRLMEGFTLALALSLEEGQLTEQEQARAEELRATKYAAPEWTQRR